jgi:HPt (histidine-containing phosphotransfer) domain-containing protein
LRLTAHTLKSSGNDFGATQFAQLCQQLEDLGQSGRLDGSESLVEQISLEYERVRISLSAVKHEPFLEGDRQSGSEHQVQDTEDANAIDNAAAFSKELEVAPFNIESVATLIGRDPALLEELLVNVYNVAPHLAEDIQQWIYSLEQWQQARPRFRPADK